MINRRSRSKQKVASKDKGKISYRTNEQIRAEIVRVIVDSGDDKDKKNIICSIEQALQMAKGANLELVEIAPEADPPVCKIVDYSKFMYEMKKRLDKMKTNSNKKIVKEISFGPKIAEKDYNDKIRNATRFLKDGAYVEAYVCFKKNDPLFLRKQGESLLKMFVKELEDYGVSEYEEPEIISEKRIFMPVRPVKGRKRPSNPNEVKQN